MIEYVPAIVLDALPWWLATPLLQIVLLITGMALDETYVNRATVFAGALALYVHSVVFGGFWLPVALYLDIGLILGAYGLYAYVVDGYVGTPFRVLAYFVYSPLSVFLVILFPDVIFFVALAIAAVVNVQLMNYFHPAEPYYFGPESEEVFEETLEETDGHAPGEPAAGPAVGPQPGAGVTGHDHVESPSTTTPAGGEQPSERSVLPEFMRRL